MITKYKVAITASHSQYFREWGGGGGELQAIWDKYNYADD